MKVSVVSPFFNEEKVIAKSVRLMVENLKKQFDLNWELILVNDGSTDNSLSELMAILKDMDETRVRVISYLTNQGRGHALKAGIDEASGDLVVTTEVDCSWGHDIVKRLVSKLDANPGSHFVIASPHLRGGGLFNVSFSRRLLTKAVNLLIRLFFAFDVTMYTGMTRCYRREVIQPLVAHCRGKDFHLEVLLKLLTLDFKHLEIPACITWPESRKGKKKSSRRSSTRIGQTIINHLQFIAIAQPVSIFAILSAVSFLTSACFLAWAIWRLAKGDISIYLVLLSVSLSLFGLLFAASSVLFFQIREVMREHWMSYYPKPWPPARIKYSVVNPDRKRIN